MEALHDEALKLGIDLGDLQDYGFDKNSKKISFDNYDDFVNKVSNLRYNFLMSLGKVYADKVACNPFVQNNIHPNVQYIWDFFPLNYFLGDWVIIADVILFPFCWLLWIFTLAFSLPWNIVCYSIVIPIIILAVVMMPCTIYCACMIQCCCGGG